MPRTSLASYLRTERLRSGLSQRELGELFGLCRSAVTKVENGRTPSMALLLATEVVFGLRTEDMFPRLYDAAKDDILLRVVAMDIRLADRTDAVSLRKRAHLGDLINRLQFNLPLS